VVECRDGVFRAVVGTAIAGTAIASQPAAAADDPIFAAIDAHRAAVDAGNSIIGVHSILEDELPRDKRRSSVICFEEDIVETDDPRWIDAERGVSRAWDTEYSIAVDLLNVRPTTLAGVLALLQYANAADIDGEVWPTDLLSDDGEKTRSWHYFPIEALAETLPTLAETRPEYSHCNQARRLTPRRVFLLIDGSILLRGYAGGSNLTGWRPY